MTLLRPVAGRSWRELARPGWDRVLRAHRRYTAGNGDALAGALVYAMLVGSAPAILLVTTALSAVGTTADSTLASLHRAADLLLPGDVAGVVDAVRPHLAGVRATLLILLIWTSLRLVRATRTAVRAMCGQNAGSGNPVRDAALDAALGVLLLTVLTVVVAATAVIDVDSWLRVPVGGLVVWLLTAGIMLRASWPKPGRPTVSAALRASFAAAVLVGMLTLAAAHYFRATAALHGDVYQAAGTLVGVLVWCSLACRVLLRATAWASTAVPSPAGPPPAAPPPAVPPPVGPPAAGSAAGAGS